ncbi:hypothetical protein [uncultured Tateyamaria sp.]|uniref:hypothetical protein n=1 Tax=uncultured Tateyamaria sp. TaxID=455651 RepID=UPI002639AEE2|nr:hypothetical protein [uncultured Tateyamaria sp.]
MIFESRFQGRNAVFCRGAAGQDQGIASRINAEGGTVEVWDINADAFAALDLDSRQIDVTDAAAVGLAMQESNPGVLVYSAGITGPNTTTRDCPVDDWLLGLRPELERRFPLQSRRRTDQAGQGMGRSHPPLLRRHVNDRPRGTRDRRWLMYLGSRLPGCMRTERTPV